MGRWQSPSILFTCLGLMLAAIASAQENKGHLSLFRWNTGYRAQSEPTLEKSMTERDFRIFLQKIPEEDGEKLFSGCYLAHFKHAPDRKPASSYKPESEVHRVCLNHKSAPGLNP